MGRPDDRIAVGVLALVAVLLPACAQAPHDRTRFANPDDAAKALLHGLETNDAEELKATFGPDVERDFSSGDPASDRHDRQTIALAMKQSWRWAPLADDRQELVIGDEQWPFPVPLMKAGSGWQFDTEAGKDEILSRRVGRNELRVIDVCRAYVDIQEAYASEPRDGKRRGLYAEKLRSTPGRQDGLYWPVGPKGRPSPLGDLAARASEGGDDADHGVSRPFWGYRFRVLTGQGPAARGGARSYLINGEMSGGFGLIAYPAEYGRSGVMTFIVNQDGVVYQKDLGEETPKVAPGLTTYDPDQTWTEVKEPAG